MAVVAILFFCVTIASANEVVLEWDANTEPDMASYRVYQSNTNGEYSAPVMEVAHPTTTCTISGLEDGTYFWVVTAVDQLGNESGFSNEVTTTFKAGAPSAPSIRLKIVIEVPLQ